MPIRTRSNSRFVISDPVLTRNGDETFGIAKKFLFMDKANLAEEDVITHVVTPEQARKLDVLAEKIGNDFPKSVFFASNLIFASDNWFKRLLHNETATALQRRLHLRGLQMVILPMKLGER